MPNDESTSALAEAVKPKDPGLTRHVLLPTREEVRLVIERKRRLHVALPDASRPDFWHSEDERIRWLVRVRPQRREFDWREANAVREKAPTARVIVESAELMLLGDIPLADGRLLLGDKRATRTEQRRWWIERHDPWWAGLSPEGRADVRPLSIDRRFEEVWASWQVWRIAWIVDPDEKRLLGADGGPAYVTSGARALHGVGEAVPADVQDEFCKDAQPFIQEATRATAASSRSAYEIGRKAARNFRRPRPGAVTVTPKCEEA